MVIGAAMLAIVAAVYLLTFQTDICSNPSEYVIDSGEYQIALALWGTVHHTGAPTYSLLGSMFVSLLRWMGVAPAAGAALFSAACALVALGFIYALGIRLTSNPLASGAAVLALALSRSFWINSVVTEIYAFGLALSAASLWLAVRYAQTPSDKTLYALAFVWGQAIVHHRLAVFMAPALAVLVLPGLWSSRRRILRLLTGSIGMGALAFAFYLYMPLRARMGAWTYGAPGTWDGFWFIFWAREVPFLLNPPADVSGLLQNVWTVLTTLATEWTVPALIAAGAGLVASAAWHKTRQSGWALTALVLSFMVFVSIFRDAVSPEEVLLWASMGLAVALTIVIARAGTMHRWLGAVCAAGLIALAGLSVATHRAEVLALTRDPRGRQVIQLLQTQMPGGRGGVEPTFMALWGGDYFAAAYGRHVTGELSGMRVVDHRANFRQIIESGSRLITLPGTFHLLPKSWWRERIGGAYLSSAGLGLVEIGAAPPLSLSDVPPGQPVDLGDGIRLLAYRIRPMDGSLHVTLYWQATQTPSQNYSVFVHLSEKTQVDAPGSLIAQSDSQNPVYGWYPTTKWSAGEIVREDYRVDVPPDKTLRLFPAGNLELTAGMYTRDASGAFHNLGIVCLPLAEQEPR